MDFDTWFQQAQTEQQTYSAVFDTDSGQVLRVGPTAAFPEQNKVDIPVETAMDILEGRIKIVNCFIDFDSEKLEVTEIHNLFKIDDVLHRITESQWSDIVNPDILLTYSEEDSIITIELSKEYGGTNDTGTDRTRNMFWNGDTVLNFMITGYNDPHIIYDVFSFTIDDLKGQRQFFKIEDVGNRFSVYTRRVFKKYMLEVK